MARLTTKAVKDFARSANQSAKQASTKQASKIGKGLVNNVLSKDDGVKNLKNLYTGKRINPTTLGVATIGAGALALSASTGFRQGPIESAKSLTGERHVYRNSMNTIFDLKASAQNAQPSMGLSHAPMMVADGRADRDLGAEGTMLFGMHNKRHG